MKNWLIRLNRLFFERNSSHHLQIDSLDGLRGLAILWVVLGHLSGVHMPLIPGLDLKGSAVYGVYLFFILSAFLLTYPLWNQDRKTLLKIRPWLRYFLRRVLRIYPMYTLVLIACALATDRFPALKKFIPLTSHRLLKHLVLMRGHDILWAVAVEFKFYLVLPLVVIIFSLIAKKRIWLCALLVAIASALMVRLSPKEFDAHITLLPFLPIFLIGTLASLIQTAMAASPRLKARPFPALFELAAVLAFAAVFLTVPSVWNRVTGARVGFNFFHSRVVFFGAAWSLFLLAFLNGAGIIRAILASRPARLIGIISYSVYLLHYPILLAVRFLFPVAPSVRAMIMVVLTFAVCCCTHLLIERPFIRLG